MVFGRGHSRRSYRLCVRRLYQLLPAPNAIGLQLNTVKCEVGNLAAEGAHGLHQDDELPGIENSRDADSSPRSNNISRGSRSASASSVGPVSEALFSSTTTASHHSVACPSLEHRIIHRASVTGLQPRQDHQSASARQVSLRSPLPRRLTSQPTLPLLPFRSSRATKQCLAGCAAR